MRLRVQQPIFHAGRRWFKGDVIEEIQPHAGQAFVDAGEAVVIMSAPSPPPPASPAKPEANPKKERAAPKKKARGAKKKGGWS